MAKPVKDQAMPPVDRALRDAFRTIEAAPVPDAITDHVDRLTVDPEEPEEPA
ncbi:hypothetical protein [Brevundimonas sp.]|uniref:hypothetical protein n=1 Tax=Brevundimonas sp. TaxID=1871086 RepID=UPI002ED8E823